jgi:hypothetical protein
MDTLIIMGRCCRISFDIKKLGYSYPTSMFEWTWTDTFAEVNYVIEKVINKEPLTIFRNYYGQDNIEGTHIVTSHYLNRNYKEILDRRANRFIEDVKSNKKIVFIRDDVKDTITIEEIIKFKELINRINPECNYRILLISEQSSSKIIIDEKVIQEKYNVSNYKDYINKCFPT